MLAEQVWKYTSRATPLDNVIDVQVSRLRQKVDNPFGRALIRTTAEEALDPGAGEEDRGLALATDLDGAGWVHGDEGLLMEAVINLVDNAVKWSPPGGRIFLTASPEAGGPRLCVRDEGPGLDPAMVDQLFERFRGHPAAPYKGSGLGLSIVYEVMRLHHGRVYAESGSGPGAVLNLCFPAPCGPRSEGPNAWHADRARAARGTAVNR